jgi:hypothetical protein
LLFLLEQFFEHLRVHVEPLHFHSRLRPELLLHSLVQRLRLFLVPVLPGFEPRMLLYEVFQLPLSLPVLVWLRPLLYERVPTQLQRVPVPHFYFVLF